MLYKRTNFKGINNMKSKLEDQPVEMQDLEDRETDIIVDDYKDMPIETVASSRKRFLQWEGFED